MAYTPLFKTMLDSTVWQEDGNIRLVWITLLLLKDYTGIVKIGIPGLANRARVSLADCEAAIEKFQAPDKYSTSQEHEGRRIVRIEDEGGEPAWQILNHEKYRSKMRDRGDYFKRYRARRRQNNPSLPDAGDEIEQSH